VRHKPQNGLRKSEWMVDDVTMHQAKEIVARLHYSRGSSHTAVFRHGLFRNEDFPLYISGCAMWMPPTNRAAKASTDGEWRRVLALSRLVIEPEVPTNGASFLLSQSVKRIARDGRWDVLVTYADEWQGHTGAIYKACGWEYRGLTVATPTYVKNGVLTARLSTKTRTHAQMIDLGAEMIGKFAKHKFVKVLR